MKKILLGISGGIAAYKTPDLARQLIASNYEVKIVTTKNAAEFVSMLTLKTLLPNRVFDTLIEPDMHHIQLAKWADIILIAPATANIIAKLTHGFADDLLSAICLATTARIIIAPAMNQHMWLHSATQQNTNQLIQRGVTFLGPAKGIQACGDNGPGRMLEPSEIVNALSHITKPFLNSTRILITAGATSEPIDPVRFITNKSSGKMGYALAHAAKAAGAYVTLISGETTITPPLCDQLIKASTAADMQRAVENQIDNHDIFISVAAVSDFTVVNPSKQKIKRNKETLTLTLTPTNDILSMIAKRNQKPFLVGFAAETGSVIENAKAKRLRKGIDMIIANDVSQSDIGFSSDDNAVTVITENHVTHLEKCAKDVLATQLLAIIDDAYKVNPN